MLFFWFSGVYNEATNEIVTGGAGNVTVSTHLRLLYLIQLMFESHIDLNEFKTLGERREEKEMNSPQPSKLILYGTSKNQPLQSKSTWNPGTCVQCTGLTCAHWC